MSSAIFFPTVSMSWKPGRLMLPFRSVVVGPGCTEKISMGVLLLKLYSHHAHHGILGSLAGDVGQRMPIGADF